MPRIRPEILMARGKIAPSRRRRLCWLGFGLAALGALTRSDARAQMLVTHPGTEGFSVENGSAVFGDDAPVSVEPLRSAARSDILDQRIADGRQVIPVLPDRAAYRGDSWLAKVARSRPFFYLNIGALYDDNIFVRRDKVIDFVTTIEPGMMVAFGNYRKALPALQATQQVYDSPQDADTSKRFVYLDYHPTIYLFARHDSEDSVDQSVLLLGSYDLARLTLSGRLQYQKLTDTNFDVGGRVDRSFYTAELGALYDYDDKFSWEAKLSAQDREYQAPYVDSTDARGQGYLNYKMGPKTSLSAGLGFGYVSYRPDVDQTYEQALLRWHRAQSAKLDFAFTGGIEFRQSSGNKSNVNGIFDLTMSFRYSDNTTFVLSGSRETEPSPVANVDETYTRLSLSVQQRLAQRVFLTLTGAYANNLYQRVSNEKAFTRTDDVFGLFVGINVVITNTTTAQLSYQFRDNSSTASILTYTQNVGGVYFRTLF